MGSCLKLLETVKKRERRLKRTHSKSARTWSWHSYGKTYRVSGFGAYCRCFFLRGRGPQWLPLVTLSDVRNIEKTAVVPFDAEQPLEFRFPDIGRIGSWLKNEHVWCWEWLWHCLHCLISSVSSYATQMLPRTILLFACCRVDNSRGFFFHWIPAALKRQRKKKRNTVLLGEAFLFNQPPASRVMSHMWPDRSLTPLCPWVHPSCKPAQRQTSCCLFAPTPTLIIL